MWSGSRSSKSPWTFPFPHPTFIFVLLCFFLSFQSERGESKPDTSDRLGVLGSSECASSCQSRSVALVSCPLPSHRPCLYVVCLSESDHELATRFSPASFEFVGYDPAKNFFRTLPPGPSPIKGLSPAASINSFKKERTHFFSMGLYSFLSFSQFFPPLLPVFIQP